MKIISLRAKKHKNFNLALFFTMLILLIIGCVFVYSASFYSAEITYHDKLFFVKYLMGAEIYVTYSHPLKA